MNLPPARFNNCVLVCGAILACFLYLATANLDYVRLWDDEAIQMFIARNFAAFGEPLVFDGRNLYSNDDSGATAGISENLHHQHPQLIYYAGWLAVKIFGDNEQSGRLLCALFGFAAMLVFWRILAREFAGRPFLICAALALACFAPMTLLHVRQFQYYSLGLFFTMSVFYFYLRYLDTKKIRHLVCMTFAAVFLFHAHYLISAAFVASLAVFHAIFRGEYFNRRDWLYFVAAAVLWAGASVWYFLDSGHIGMLARYDNPQHQYEGFFSHHVVLIWRHLRALNENGVLPWTITAWLFYFIFSRMRAAKTENTEWKTAWRTAAGEKTAQYGFIVLLYATAIGAMTPDPVLKWAHARYLIAVMPFAAVAAAAAAEWTARKTNKFCGGALLAAFLLSNIAAAPFANHHHYGNKLIFTLPALIREIHRPYPSGIGASLKYMQTHAKQDDVVFIRPYYYAHPIRYYLGDFLRICCILSGSSPLSERFEKTHPWLLSEKARPKWIISYGGALSAAEITQLKQIGDYRLVISLPVFEPGFSPYRPEPVLHLYSHSLKELARANPDQQVYIYRRK